MLRDKGAMIRLAKSTYRKVAESVAKVGLCRQASHIPSQCHICTRSTRGVFRWVKEYTSLRNVWCLCDYHKREAGVLW